MRAEEQLFDKSNDLDGDVHILSRGNGAFANGGSARQQRSESDDDGRSIPAPS